MPSPLQVYAHQGRGGTAVLLTLEAPAQVLGIDEPGAPSVPAVLMLRDGAPAWSHRIALEQGRIMGGRVLVTERGVVYAAVGSEGSESSGGSMLLIALDASTGAELSRTRFEGAGPESWATPEALVTAAEGDLVVAIAFGADLRLPGGSSRPIAGGHHSVAVVRLSPDLATVRHATHLPSVAQSHLVARDDGGVDVFAMLPGRFPLRVGRHSLRPARDVWARLVAVRLDAGGSALDLASFVVPEGASLQAPFERGGARVLATQRSWGAGQVPLPPCEILAAAEPLADMRLECEDTPGVVVRSADGARGWVWRVDRPAAQPLREPTVSLALERVGEPGAEVPAAAILDVRARWDVTPLAVLDSDTTPRLLVLTRPVLPGGAGEASFVALVTLPPPGARADLGPATP